LPKHPLPVAGVTSSPFAEVRRPTVDPSLVLDGRSSEWNWTVEPWLAEA